MRKNLLVFFAALLVALGMAAGSARRKAHRTSAQLPAVADSALGSISPERIRAHVRFLADDLLEGRGTGQRGGDLAAAYMATEFALDGLNPAGDNGAYMQNVPMVGVTTLPETTFTLVSDQGQSIPLRLAADVVLSNETQQSEADVDADIVYVGYGISAPEYHWDDYKGTDVRGKVLLMLVNEPPSDDPKFFKGKALTYYGRWTYKFEEAARRGAVAAILMHKSDMASYGWEVVRNSWSGEQAYLRSEPGPKLTAASWMQWDIARNLAATAGKNLDAMMAEARKPEFRPLPLTVKLRAHIISRIRPFVASNVIAMLPGSDAKLKSQAVIYTAHYDHLGIVPGQAADNIYNGALDNATGCGILLEIARAYASAKAKPARSILFASVTGEEKGLLGSEYLGKHAPIPASKIVLDLNYDDVPPLGVPEESEVSGAERTTFYPVVEETARDFRLSIRPDARPEAGHYYRSDHFSLARLGIPSFSINEGIKYKGHDSAWGIKQAEDYTAKHYHQPSDEYHPDMDFAGDAVMAQFGFALGWKAASEPAAIAWLKGDEFESTREKSMVGGQN
ncbi:MAG: M28 family peptidase [Acidobacteria bacterium]|nr:M28 family peptidase [Acidobacteriota bacterium]